MSGKTCRFVEVDGVVYVPSPGSWLEGWARQRWLERGFKDRDIRVAGAEYWGDLVTQNEVFVLTEANGNFYKTSVSVVHEAVAKKKKKKKTKKAP